MNKFIDIHTHNEKTKSASIYNFSFIEDNEVPEERYFSIGIHPWFLEKINIDRSLSFLKDKINHPFCMAIGEIGLDYKCDIPRQEQIKFFALQMHIASSYNVRVVILHCVRAYNDIIRIIKESKYQGYLIFHDYNGNLEVTKSLLKYKAYFSFGKSIFRQNNQFSGQFALIKDRFFLETDEQTEYSIENIYYKAAALSRCTDNDLQRLLQQNFINCFGEKMGII